MILIMMLILFRSGLQLQPITVQAIRIRSYIELKVKKQSQVAQIVRSTCVARNFGGVSC